ncbi:alpha/beta hydrolase [Planctomicrobium piriforme]|uniref:Prolyl oligopeptidase family protein n=1 Tax=Planctomicrobium piriforme TaxID=1576369 RepID=A0A1I3E632_9PLAN|nr:hypothetical protein [Planctomicrobium piriforme]SFH94447.1 hypothetical protein SAMN05421753_10496 [Planctomicrobium piriforme]
MLRRILAVCLFSLLVFADQVTFAQPAAKVIPAPGIDLPPAARTHINKKRVDLNRKIAALAKQGPREILELLPDVEIFSRAAELAVDGNTIYSEQEFNNLDKQLDLGLERAAELAKGEHSWTTQTGLVVRGFRSKLDGTVQPYGLLIGPDAKLDGEPMRLDIWFHGRGDKTTETQFIQSRLKSEGEYKIPDGIVLHPYGRFCNPFRFAGEVDVWEALEHVKQNYKIDPDRMAVGGFSMGGAGCWGFTVHYPSSWFASYPGAGFSDTERFLGMDKNPEKLPSPIQQKLWRLYDAHTLADNLYDVPTIAYSGEIDGQKLASDIMVEAAAKYGLEIPHIIGPQTGHKIHADSKLIIEEKLNALAAKGRVITPPSIRFTTYSLKYNTCAWATINGLGEHWEEAYIHADLTPQTDPTGVEVKTKNLTDLSLNFPAASSPFAASKGVKVTIDGQALPELKSASDKAFVARFRKQGDKWASVKPDAEPEGLVKRHDLQGPVDDALMAPFLFVKPTGTFVNTTVGAWVNSEMNRAVNNWERQMRGNARVKKDTEITEADIRDNNLILWGCPRSNALIKKIITQLPIIWSSSELSVGKTEYEPAHQALIMIYPNPLNPSRYIVINSSLTYRETDYENNAKQTPKLPDWAIIELNQAPNDYAPGGIIAADFFDEQWKVKTPK